MTADVVERVRMAVAEAGYDPRLISAPLAQHNSFRASGTIPLRVRWRARETAAAGEPDCWACYQWADSHRSGVVMPPLDLCHADRRFMEDCGVERPS